MSLHPIKSKSKPKAKRAYGSLKVEHGWDTGEKKPWTPGKLSKAAILLGIVLLVAFVPAYGYYANVYLPSLPQPQKPDPFTTLWNGQSKQQVSISLDAHVKSANCNTANCAATITGQSAGDLLVVTAADFDESACPGGMTISDGQSLTWHEIGCVFSHSTFQFGQAIAWYATGVSSGSDLITIHDATGTKAFSAQAYNGASSATGLQTDSGNNVGSSGTTTTTGFLSSDYIVDFVDATDNADVLGTTWAFSAFVTSIDTNAPVAGGWPNFAVGHGIGTAAGYADMWSTADANIGYQHLTFILTPSGGQGATNVIDTLQPTVMFASVLQAISSGESFTSSSSFSVASVEFLMNESGTFTGSIVAQLFLNTGTPGAGATPTGGPIATSTTIITSGLLSTGPASPVTFQFSNTPTLVAGNYWVTLNASSVPITGGSPFLWRNNAHIGGHNRAFFNPPPPTWTALDQNLWFIVFGTVPGACIIGYKCFNTSIVNSNLATNPTATFPSVALTNSSIDLSTCAGKACAFSEGITGFSTPYTGTEEWAWFLTQNNTLPVSQSYSPLQDPSVALLVIAVGQSPSANPPPVMDYYVYMQRQPGQVMSIGKDDPYPVCPQTGTLFICQSFQNTAFNFLNLVLNYTGNGGMVSTSGESYLCIGGGSGSKDCLVGGANNVQIDFANTFLNINYTQPWLNLQNNYYQGFWQNPLGSNIEAATGWGTSPTTASLQTNVISVYVPATSPANPQTTEGGFFGWVGRALGGAYNFVAGALSPIVAPALNFGNSLLSVFVSGLIQAGNLLVKGLTVLETVMIIETNAIGNFLGFGNLGTDIATLINSLLSFFTNGSFSNAFGFLGTGFTYLFDASTIAISWFGVAVGFVNTGLAWATGTIGFVGMALYWFFLGWSSLFATIIIILWFIDLGDYGAQGGLIWFDTVRWLFFGTGIGFIFKIINLGLDMFTYLLGLIPKPFIQMVAHSIPRLPIIEASGSPTFPDGHMEAARNGNVFTVLGWMVGFFFTVAFEGTTLPGSIAGFVPAAASSTNLLTLTLPLMEIMLFMGGLTLVFILPAKLVNFMPDMFEKNMPGRNIPISLRSEAPARGPTHLGISAGKKRFQGRIEKQLGLSKEKAKKAEEQRRNAEQQRKQAEAQELRRRIEERLKREEQQRARIRVQQAGG